MAQYKATVKLYFEATDIRWAEIHMNYLREHCCEATRDGPALFRRMDVQLEEVVEKLI